MQEVQVTILEMEHHFLYLPLYFAKAQDFFGYVPGQYRTTIVQAAGGTDADAYRRFAQGEAQLVVCDPCALIYAAQATFRPQVLAGLVIRGAFWAVNGKSPDISELDELAQYERIIAFYPGTTSHGIAKRIVRSAKANAPVIEAVRPLQELTRLEDLVNDKKNAVALSPDILRIERSLEANQEWLSIKLALADTVEYAHLLVTAVIASASFLSAHPTFIRGFLKGLQRSLIHASAEDPAVLSYATDAFNQPPGIVQRALRRANDAQVWAPTVAISEDLWLNAVEAYSDSMGKPFDGAAKRAAQKHFVDAFKGNVEPAQRAALEILHSGAPEPSNGSWKGPLLAALGALIGICALLAWQGHASAHLPLALGILSLPVASGPKGMKRIVGWNTLIFILFGVLWVVRWLVHWGSDEAYAGTVVALMVLFAERNFRILAEDQGLDG